MLLLLLLQPAESDFISFLTTTIADTDALSSLEPVEGKGRRMKKEGWSEASAIARSNLLDGKATRCLSLCIFCGRWASWC